MLLGFRKRVLNFNHLHYFHVAATEGSLAKAAEKLDVTQSTMSEQLRALERAVRKKLFERSTTGMRLTPAGKVAYEYSSAIFRSGERLEQVLRDEPDDTPISLRVGTSGTLSRATAADFLLPLFEMENCMPTIRVGDTVELLRDVRANDLDLVLCETEPTGSALEGLEHRVVARIPLVAIAGTDREPGGRWDDLGLVQYPTSSSFYWEVVQFLDAEKLDPRIVGEADDPALLVELAARSGHIAVVPAGAARDALASGRVRLLKKLDSAHAAVHALHPNGTSAELARHAIDRLVGASSSS